MINSNPETVSTDFDASTRLYFEPLDPESVRNVIDAESPDEADLLPAVVAFGGQTPLNLAAPLAAGGVPLLGSGLETIDQAEERTRFAALLDRLGIPQPEGGMAHSMEEALTLAERIGYPVIVRPSFVIGGLAIDFCYSAADLARQLAAATVVDPDRPGPDRSLPRGDRGRRRRGLGRRGGPHPRDSSSTSNGPVSTRAIRSASSRRRPSATATRRSSSRRWSGSPWRSGRAGLVNAQFIVRDDGVYLIEVNPRASRTVPFLSKVTGVPMVELAVRISLGATLRDLGWSGGLLPPPPFVAVKAPAFSTAKLRGVDPSVGPFMQSTGEVIGIHVDPRVALAKALLGASLVPPRPGADGALALLSIADRDKGPLPRLAAALAGRLPAGGDARHACGARRRGSRGPAGRQARRGCRRGGGEVAILDLIASGEVRLVVNTPDAALGGRPRCGRHPAGRDRGGDPLPDRHRDRGRRRRGARSGDRRSARRRPLARSVGAVGPRSSPAAV